MLHIEEEEDVDGSQHQVEEPPAVGGAYDVRLLGHHPESGAQPVNACRGTSSSYSTRVGSSSALNIGLLLTEDSQHPLFEDPREEHENGKPGPQHADLWGQSSALH